MCEHKCGLNECARVGLRVDVSVHGCMCFGVSLCVYVYMSSFVFGLYVVVFVCLLKCLCVCPCCLFS